MGPGCDAMKGERVATDASTTPVPEARSSSLEGRPADRLAVFGITGDLARVMTFRSLYRLERHGLLDCPILGVAADDWTVDRLIERARESIVGTGEPLDEDVFGRFAARLSYVSGDFGDAATYARVADALGDAQLPVFYLEIPPSLFGRVVKGLAEAGLTRSARVVVEKPFGHDLASAQALAAELHGYIDEAQLFRIDHFLGIDPTAMELLGVKSSLAIAEKGDFGVAETGFEALKSIPMTNEQKLRTADARADVFLLERRYSDGLREAESLSDDQAASYPTGLWSKYYHIGFARRALEDESGARAAFLKAKSAAEEQLKRTPDVAKLRIQLAKVLAFLGEKDFAMAEAQRASELQPESKDAFEGPAITEGVAQVCAILGAKDRAIEILDGLLNRPSYVTVQGLKVNPIWDSLRNDRRFQALIDRDDVSLASNLR